MSAAGARRQQRAGSYGYKFRPTSLADFYGEVFESIDDEWLTESVTVTRGRTIVSATRSCIDVDAPVVLSADRYNDSGELIAVADAVYEPKVPEVFELANENWDDALDLELLSPDPLEQAIVASWDALVKAVTV